MEELIGAAEFQRLTGADNFQVRLLEAARVITPARCGRWRVFTRKDVDAVLAHQADERNKATAPAHPDKLGVWERLGVTT
jgi:hypothetical protein